MFVSIIEMIQNPQGIMVFHLLGMGVLFILMGIMISRIGSGKSFRRDTQSDNASTIDQKSGKTQLQTEFEITAAITAAVNEYKKNN